MNEKQMLEIVELYIREGGVEQNEIKITQIADQKSIFVERIGEENGGQAIVMTEYKVDGAKCRAGYSWRSQTVYISLAT
ncbi:MAG: hypothetical protein QME21_05135 [Anaerolineales bacterium]|jgi:hypothetical protein|nr:hypothetical protein [Anaerolineales bacterium]